MAKIIIIDDSDAVRANLKVVLETAKHSVTEAINGIEGLNKILTSSSTDLVITDYNMPGLDGIQMLTKAKEKLGKFEFFVFMLTTESNEKLKAAGKEAGVNAWILKPLVPATMLTAIAAVMKKRTL